MTPGSTPCSARAPERTSVTFSPLSHRRSAAGATLSAPARWIGVVVVVAAAGFAAVGLVGNTALSRSDAARQNHDWTRAADDARRAKMWMPWSPRPWEALGRAQLGAGLLPAAKASF